MADAATMTIKAVLLPDEIQTTLKDLTFSYTPADANNKWFYSLAIVRHDASGNLIGSGGYLSNSAGISSVSETESISVSDRVKFLFIKNTGTTDGSTTTDESVMLVFDGSTVAYSSLNAVEIGAGESWFVKLPNTPVDYLHCITADSNGSSAGEGYVQCIIAAIIDDVSE